VTNGYKVVIAYSKNTVADMDLPKIKKEFVDG
jgi:hypothetical protein